MSHVAASAPAPTTSVKPVTKSKTWLAPVFFVAGLVYLPLLFKLGRRLWATDHYSFFPLILVGAAFMIGLRLKEFGRLAPGKVWRRNILTSLSLFVFAAAVLVNSPLLAGISALMFVLAMIYAVGGGDLVKELSPVWLFLWLMIPLPLGFDTQLILGLQRIATSWGSSTLDVMGVRHLVEGVVLQLPGQSFEVEEACSGIRSLFAALACTAFYLILNRRPLLRSLLLLGSVLFWVLVANAIRVVAVVKLTTDWGLAVDKGIGHDFVGIACFALVMGMVASTDSLFMFIVPTGVSFKDVLRRILRRAPSSQPFTAEDAASTRRRRRVSKGANLPAPFRPFSFEAMGMLLVLFGLGLAQVAHAGMRSPAPPTGPVARLQETGDDLLPKEFNGWTQIGYEDKKRSKTDINGQQSRVWVYIKGGRRAVVSIDGPFHGWHNLGNCLEGQGWTIDSWQDAPYDLKEPNAGGFSEVRANNGVGRHGHILFGVFDVENRPFNPPQGDRFGRQWARRFPGLRDIANQWSGQVDDRVAQDDSKSYQVQVFTENVQTFLADELQDDRHLFHHFTKMITEK